MPVTVGIKKGTELLLKEIKELILDKKELKKEIKKYGKEKALGKRQQRKPQKQKK